MSSLESRSHPALRRRYVGGSDFKVKTWAHFTRRKFRRPNPERSSVGREASVKDAGRWFESARSGNQKVGYPGSELIMYVYSAAAGIF